MPKFAKITTTGPYKEPEIPLRDLYCAYKENRTLKTDIGELGRELLAARAEIEHLRGVTRAAIDDKKLALTRVARLETLLRELSKGLENDFKKEKELQPPKRAPALYPGGRENDPLEFLKTHYGKYLAYFGASTTVLFRYQLKELDPKLLTSLQNRLNYLRRRDPRTPFLAEIVPPRTAETEKRILDVALFGTPVSPGLNLLIWNRRKAMECALTSQDE